ncbi:MAG: TIGR04100 family radical SAM protein [Eggerthellaceae bacterium]|nr:TIGR04100 family radical SAM protein [Eggerthellaceae bacterium]
MKNKAMTILYEVHNGLYVNLTNRCSCACTFCVRQTDDSVGKSDTLWLEHEPTFEEVMAAFDDFDMSKYEELVFCGFGEPTEAFDTLKRVAAEAKRRWNIPVRVNTNGQGSLINERDIAPEFEGIVDTVSISLNTPNAEEYLKLTRSRYKEQAFPAMLEFAREVKKYVPNVVMSTVGTTITHEEEEQCQTLCNELGVTYRIRPWID